ncbi:MAG: hypothetical protein GYA81_04975, partial [Chloroflexi bacterium]|nr:hypothetical protein [Chloroflexota bacterium]
MKLKYIGPSFGVESLTDGKVYICLGFEDGLLRIVDDSEEDYLYSVIPGPWDDQTIRGRWEVVEDDEDRTLTKLFEDVRISLENEARIGI